MNKAGDQEERKDEKLDARIVDGDYSYLDYIIEKKFYRRFRSTIFSWWTIVTVVFGALAFFGFNTLADYRSFLREFEDARTKLQPVYVDLIRQDSLRQVIIENSRYSCEVVNMNLVEPQQLESMLRSNGFRYLRVQEELWFRSHTSAIDGNPAVKFTYDNQSKQSGVVYVGVYYNGVPEIIRNRISQIVYAAYPDVAVELKFFEGRELPNATFLYCVDISSAG